MDPITLAILGITGIMGGFISTIVDGVNGIEYQKQYEFEKKQIEDAQKANLDLLDTKFDIEKKNALKDADITDNAMDIEERNLSNGINAALDDLNASQLQNTYEWNNQAMQNGMQKGSELSTLAASGIRTGNSLAQAIELESALNSSQLQLTEDITRTAQRNSLNQALAGLDKGKFGIWQNRDNADYLRNSYAEGGDAYTLYQKNRENTVLSYQQKMDQLKFEYDDYMSAGSRMLRIASGAFNFGSQLNKTANSIREVL